MIKKNWPAIVFLFVNILFSLYIFCTRNNTTIGDLSGHFASAKFFSQGYFHSYNDNQFLGLIQNLFYPPLQDILITAISFFTSSNFAKAGLIYISIIYIFYLFSITYLSGIFKNLTIQFSFLFLVTLWLLLDKNYNMTSGLSLDDLISTGLSTQFLGTIFLFVLIRAVIEKRNYLWICFLISICFYAHIFVGLLAFSLVIGYALTEKKYFYSILLSIGICSTIWLPFLYHANFVVNYSVFDRSNVRLAFYTFLSLSFFIFLFFIRKNSIKEKKYFNSISIFLSGAFLIFLLNCIGAYNLFDLPKFHYSRLVVYGYLFILLEFSMYMQENFLQLKNKIIFFSFIVTLIVSFNLDGAHFFQEKKFISVEIENNFDFKENNNYSRTYLVPNKYPPDLYLAQHLQALLPTNFNSAQGLYWESSKSNYILSSYNSMLFQEHTGVIDYVWYTLSSCAVQACYLDQFFRDYNIDTLVVEPSLYSSGLPAFPKMCLSENISNQKTFKNNLEYKGNLQIKYPAIKREIGLNYYHVSQNAPSIYNNNSAIEVISPTTIIKYYDTADTYFYSHYFIALNSFCEYKVNHENADFDMLFLPEKYKNIPMQFNSSSQDSNLSQVQFKKVAKNHFNLQVDTKEPVWFKIKLSWFPGLKLFDVHEKNIPIFPGLSYIIAFGQGEMNLVYEKPLVFYVAYFISILSFFCFVGIVILKCRERKCRKC